jgi:hypothetical protein
MDARHTRRCAISFSHWIGRGLEEECCEYRFMVCQIMSQIEGKVLYFLQKELSLRSRRHHCKLETCLSLKGDSRPPALLVGWEIYRNQHIRRTTFLPGPRGAIGEQSLAIESTILIISAACSDGNVE